MEVGEYISKNVGFAHSSNPESGLGESINKVVNWYRHWYKVQLELVTITRYLNSGEYRAVFIVKERLI